jgi:lipopolysaccharide/colanic/teichoic acid biosynthesis glycosyltransferase
MSVQLVSVQERIQVNQSYLRFKRCIDVMFSLLILPFFAVLTVVVGGLILLDSPGPVFFRQKRVGLNGTEFYMLKFRSMYVNNDDQSHRQAIDRYINGQKLNNSTDRNCAYKKVDDPRITRIGRFLRKTSIDELPQFINVLRGEMSLVGPRPPLSYEVELYSAHDRLRLQGKPGLTGYWQVYGRSRVPFATMVEMDIAYLARQSLLEDLKLIALTIPVMILGVGGG